jgi:hypothetical protein
MPKVPSLFIPKPLGLHTRRLDGMVLDTLKKRQPVAAPHITSVE